MRPVITGVTFTPDITAPIEVTEPATWGWFGAGLNVRPASSRSAAYSAARLFANRHQSSVQIYANTGNGWKQVDVVPKPDREVCGWEPDRDAPWDGTDGRAHTDTAVVSVGTRRVYRLCDSCAQLPRFRRMRHNGYLAGHYQTES